MTIDIFRKIWFKVEYRRDVIRASHLINKKLIMNLIIIINYYYAPYYYLN